MAGSSAAGSEGTGFSVQPPERRIIAPGFELPALSGETVSLKSLRGSVVLLHFWATWCRPCREELPGLDRIDREWGKAVEVLAVSVDRGSPDHVRRFLDRLSPDLGFRALLDPEGDVRERYSVDMLPVSYVIGPDGVVEGRATGRQIWTGNAARRYLGRLVGRRGPGSRS